MHRSIAKQPGPPHFAAAVSNLLAFQGNPLEDLERAIAAEPRFSMAHVLKALVLGLSTDKSLMGGALSSHAAARSIESGNCAPVTRHIAAVDAWLRGGFTAACAIWEEILIEQPDDAIAMFVAHQGDFLLGHVSELRDRVARRLADLEEGSALQGYYRGMYAFGLEEMGDYDKALEIGRRAVARDGSDAWAIHAVAHVHEMTNQIDAGERWLSANMNGWADSTLSVHLWWHRALLQCDQQRWDRALDLYDSHVRRPASTVVMELLDASSLLWRLRLQDVDVGDRWQSLADAWAPHIEEGWYAFNDMHAMMAFAGAGRIDLAQRLLAVLRAAAAEPMDNGAVTRAIGLPVCEALLAYADNRYAEAAALLRPTAKLAVRAGGSHAQRDVLAQTELSAAEKAGHIAAARALLNERLALRPTSLLNQRWMQRLRRS